MAIVLIKGVLDSCLSGALIGACLGWSTYIAASLIEDICLLTPKGGSL